MPEIPLSHLLLSTLVMFLVTFGLRGFPFMAFGNGKKTPAIILYIGRVISPAVIAALIVYCLKGTQFTVPPYGSAEVVALAVCIALHQLLHNPLVSIVGSTAIYMFMVQTLGN